MSKLINKFLQPGGSATAEQNKLDKSIEYAMRNVGGEQITWNPFTWLRAGASMLIGGDRYNGTYKSGSGNLDKTSDDRDLVKLYLTGDDSGFTQLKNQPPIVIKGDTIQAKQYAANILPHEKLTLRPKSRAVLDSMINHQDLIQINSAYQGDPETIRKNVTAREYNKSLDDVGKAAISFKKDKNGYYADIVDYWDMKGTVPFGEFLDNRYTQRGAGPFIMRQRIPIQFSRDGESDGEYINALSDHKWQGYLDKYSE